MRNLFANLQLILTAAATLTYMQSELSSGYREKERNRHHKFVFACNGTGLQCKDCRSLVWCQEVDGNFTMTPAGACPITQICQKGTCIPAINSDCSPIHDFTFPCTTIGMYPDPADCRDFHICTPKNDDEPGNLKASRITCTDDGDDVYGYNPNTTFCDKKLKDKICVGYPIPTCTKLGEVHPLRENPRLYYTCAKHPSDPNVFYPYQQACPNGKMYYPNYDQCL